MGRRSGRRFCAWRIRRRSRAPEVLPRWLPSEVVRALLADLEHRER